MRRFVALLAVSLLVAAGAAGCSSSGRRDDPNARYYVAIGDSYAAGYQATSKSGGHATTDGFADQVQRAREAAGDDMVLANFGCGGATTETALHQKGCASGIGAVHGESYDVPQADAAVSFLKQHRGHVGLVTVSLGGNDAGRCTSAPNVVTCMAGVLPAVKANLTELLKRVRDAVGPTVPIIGSTYFDHYLGGLLRPNPTVDAIATASVIMYSAWLNPTLKAAYEAAGGAFVDVTAASGAYGPVTETTSLPPYGTVPVPAAKICQYTHYCEYGDGHPNTAGYKLIADLIVTALH